MLTISDFFVYFSAIWGTNIVLNILGTLKMYVPAVSNIDRPLDGGLRLQGRRLIGDSTTLLGLAICVVVAAAFYWLTSSVVWLLIPLLVYIGHTLGSIIKRRMKRGDGEFVPLLDHGDYTIVTGAVLVLGGYATVPLVLLTILVTYILHPIACLIAYSLKLRDKPF